MSTNYTIRFATNPDDFDSYDADQIREDFLIPDLFSDGDINLVYTHYDRFIVGGAKPGSSPLELETILPLKADQFLDRRELGIINVGEKGTVSVDGEDYALDFEEALYVGKEAGKV